MFTDKDEDQAELIDPLGEFTAAKLAVPKDTLGYTVFTEDLPFTTSRVFEMPRDFQGFYLKLQINGYYPCKEVEGYQDLYGIVAATCFINAIQNPIETGCEDPIGCDFLFTNRDTGNGMHVRGVKYWAASATELFFYPTISIAEINAMFPGDAFIDVEYYETGKARSENKALGHVFGTGSEFESLVIAGMYGEVNRDYTHYSVMIRPDLQAGQSLLYRQYYVVDDLESIDARAKLLAEDSYVEKFELGDLPGRVVRLFSLEGGAKFSATVDSMSCGRGEEVCTGSTTPKSGYRPFYYVKCDYDGYSETYIGSDPYALSPPGTPVQAYVCNNGDARPTWDLLGWFVEGNCETDLMYSEYDDHLCWRLSDIPSMAPSEIPSIQPTDLPSVSPSVSDAPTVSDVPSLEPTINPILGDFLDKALMEDIIPEGSAMCTGSGKTSFTFDYTEKTPEKWHEDSRPFEEQLFLAELSHTDDDSNRDWTIRVGSGSNIYSFVGMYKMHAYSIPLLLLFWCV